jgi:7-cyano-7-deazaguanine synthase
MPVDPTKAIILLSGGLDSATTLAMAIDAGRECHCISFDYNQRHRHELKAAEAIAKNHIASSHITIPINLRAFGHSALTDDIPVPKGSLCNKIPVTYVPARNLVFLSLATAYAEVTGSTEIWIGVNAIDYSGYPDCRPEFVAAFEHTANLATKAAVEGHLLTIKTPLINLSKADIIRTGTKLGLDFSQTHSCYDPDDQGRACGDCDSCILRRKGFEVADIPDPTIYTPSAQT